MTEMSRHAFTILVLGALLALAPARLAAADDPSFVLSVKRSHMVGSTAGILRLTSTGIDFETTEKSDARRWAYADIQQIRISSPTRISVLSYEDQGWLKAGADRDFDFDLRDGSVTPDIVAFILSHTARSVITVVLPEISEAPLFRQLVKHERHGRGNDGVLLMYEDALVFATERASARRYWRFTDIFAILPLDRDRLEVLAYEGGSGDLRPFTFQLKSALSDEFVRTLWTRVNPPAPFAGSAVTDRGGTSAAPDREK